MCLCLHVQHMIELFWNLGTILTSHKELMLGIVCAVLEHPLNSSLSSNVGPINNAFLYTITIISSP